MKNYARIHGTIHCISTYTSFIYNSVYTVVDERRFKLWCVLSDMQCVTESVTHCTALNTVTHCMALNTQSHTAWHSIHSHTLHGTQYTPQLETFFTTTLLNIRGITMYFY
jgi:hypothetical protein